MSNQATITLFFIFFFLFNKKSIAYQLAPSSLPHSLEILKSKAEHLNNDQLWNESIALYQEIQQQCYARGIHDLGIDLYEYIFVVTVLREDYDLNDKLAFIQQCAAKETHPNFLGLYYGAMAHAYIYYGEVDSMNKYYNLAHNIYTRDQRYEQSGNLNVTIATEYYFLGELITARVYLQKAEKLLHEKLAPHQIDIPSIYTIQTAIYTELSEYDKALISNLKSIQMYEADSTTRAIDLAYQYNNLATTYSELKDFENALAYYQKALYLIQNSPDYSADEIASLLSNIGATYFDQDNYKACKKHTLGSLNILTTYQEKTQEMVHDFIDNCHLLAKCYAHSHQPDSTLHYLQKAENINCTFPYRVATTYEIYSSFYLKQNNLTKAELYCHKALTAGITDYGEKGEFVSSSYRTLCQIAAAKKKYKEALSYCQKALEVLSFNFSDPNNLSNPALKDVFRKGELLKVLDLKMEYLEKLYSRDDPFVSEKQLFAAAKMATETLETLNKSLKSKESRLFWLNKRAIPLFEKAIQIALSIYAKNKDMKYLNEAFVLSERSKSMLMMAALQENDAFSFGGVPNQLVEKEKELHSLMVEAEKKRYDAQLIGDTKMVQYQDSLIFIYHHHIDALIHQFETQYSNYYSLKYATKVASIKDVQATLDHETTFIEYFEGKSKIYAFTITAKDAFVHTIERTPSYKHDITNFQALLINMNDVDKKPVNTYNRLIESAHNFYDKFLKNSLVEQQKRLIIIPDGLLGYIPFEVLLSQKVPTIINQTDNTVNFSILPYLIRDYTISYNYSATLLIDQQKYSKKQSNNGNILALAPSYKNKTAPSWRSQYEQKLRTELVELNGTTKELKFLKWAFKGKFLFGKTANEHAFKAQAPDYGILHLAVHGLVNNKRPDLSGLALEEDMHPQEDNILYAYEIKQLNLQAELVVLSACETGIGKYQRGEGVLSIGRGFMYAGVPSLLTTLWSLNDYSSPIIIEKFYENLSQGMQKDEAIRQAKLHYLDHYTGISTYPALWACFIQVGDYSPIHISKNNWKLQVGIASIFFLLLGILIFKKFKKR